MPVVEINDLASVGQINDIEPFMLPPEAWTLVENMRYTRGGIEVILGWEQVFGTPVVAPHFTLPVKTTTQTYWLYTSLTKAAVWDGVAHTDITRAVGGDYTANDTANWNGIVFGGVPILNNGIDVPQYWANYSAATKLTVLPNWPAALRTTILRNFGSYLVAFNLRDAGTSFPHLVQWSNPAAPGTVPTSWAYGNPVVEGGRKDLPDVNSGPILEALQLQSTMFIYKERSIWKMQYIGGQFIFSFDTFLDDVGILGPRCVCHDGSGTKHVVVTQDDIVQHNGNTPTSILTDKQRVALFAAINRDTAGTSFLFLNKTKDEIWFCYPEQGQDQPSRALVYNYRKGIGAISFVSGITFRNAVLGDVEGINTETWADGTDIWDEDTGPWSTIFRQRIVLSGASASKFYQLDETTTRDNVVFAPTLQREDLGVLGKKRDGSWINDFKRMKMVDSLHIKMSGAPIRARVGFKDLVNGPLTWQDYTTFDPSTDLWINTIVNEELPGCGLAVSVEFSALTAAPWRLDGYAMNIEAIGPY